MPFSFPKPARFDLQSALTFWIVFIALGVALAAGGLIWRGDFAVQLTAWIAAVALAAGWLVWRGLLRRARLPRTSFYLPLALALLVLLGLWAVSPDPRAGLGRISALLGVLLLFYLLLDVFDSAPFTREAALQALLFLTGLVLFAALLEVYTVYAQWWQAVGSRSIQPPFPYRLVSLVGHSNSFMGLVNLTAPLALVSLLSARRRLARVGATAWMLCYLAVLPFTSSRGGWLGAAAWMAALAVLWIWKLRGLRSAPVQAALRWARRFKVGLYAAVPAALALAAYAGYRFFIAFAAHPSHGGSLTGGRDAIWGGALAIWRAFPLLGSGPGRFGYEYAAASASIPPGFWALHAHGLLFTILAEFGALGLAVFFLAALPAGIGLFRRALRADSNSLPRTVAALAGVLGWLAQMVFDDQTAVPAVMIPLALVLAYAATPSSAPLARRARVPAAVLGLPALLLAAGAAASLWAYAPLAAALANPLDARATAAAASESARRDPSFAYYAVESGLAWASAWDASADPADLDRARRSFRRAIDLEPALTWNLANLAVLDGLAGDVPAALAGLREAVRRAPAEPSFHLNLAGWYEQSGDAGQARQSYTRALDLAPDWAGHPFWTLTPLRVSVLADWRAAHPDLSRPDYAFERAARALDSGDLPAARRWMAESEWLVEPAAGRGGVYTALADSPRAQTAALEDLLAASQSNRQEWFANLVNTYTLWLNARRGLPDVLVPGYLLLEPDFGQYAAFDRLAQDYRSSGDCSRAADVWSQAHRLAAGGALQPIPTVPPCGQDE